MPSPSESTNAQKAGEGQPDRGAWTDSLRRGFGTLVQIDATVYVLAIIVGLAASAAAIGFRESIGWIQLVFLSGRTDLVVTLVSTLDWWQVLLAPAAGGLLVGIFVARVMPGRRPRGVADVIEASALRSGHMSLRAGLGAALVSALSIGCGASVGREGPAVHIGATLGGWIANRLHLPRHSARTLLGCGVAAAVAASFNAPIAGVFFALEVVVGHYALSAFAPIVLASVSGTILSRAYFGDFPAFILPPHDIVSYWEFPAFALLGVMAAIVAIVFMRSTELVQRVWQKTPVTPMFRPAIAGLAVGAIAFVFPEVMGVGYEATDQALRNQIPLFLMIALIAAKTAATALSLGSGFGGGVFSPSLYLGAMLGGAFGTVALLPFPELHSGHGAYTLVGMGAVAAAILGAPISTILIIFEMTGDYALLVAVMVATVVATVVVEKVHGRSFFIWQLGLRGLRLKGGHDVGLFRSLKVGDVLKRNPVCVQDSADIELVRNSVADAPMAEIFEVSAEGRLLGIITLADFKDKAFDHSYDGRVCADELAWHDPPVLTPNQGLEEAMEAFSQVELGVLPVVADRDSMELIGAVHERDVMRAYTRALIRARREEHDER